MPQPAEELRPEPMPAVLAVPTPKNVRDSLFAAATHGDADQLRLLIQAGALTAPRPVRYLSGPNELFTREPTPLLIAIMHNKRRCAELLVEATATADLDARCGPDLETALHVSCARGHVAIIKALLDASADHATVDAYGRSPLLIACLADQPECASLMLASGADVEQPMTGDNPGATPLYAAACAGSQPATEVRLRRRLRLTPLTAL